MSDPKNNKRESGLLPKYSYQDGYNKVKALDAISNMDKSWQWITDWYANEETVKRMKETGYSDKYINNILNKAAPEIEFGRGPMEFGTKPLASAIGFQELPDIPLTKEEIKKGKKELPFRPGMLYGGSDMFFSDWSDTIPEHEMEHYINFGAGIGGVGRESKMVPARFGSTRETFYNPSKEDLLIFNAIPKENRFEGIDGIRNSLNKFMDFQEPKSKSDFRKEYLGSPTETRARLMEIRRALGAFPGEEINLDRLNNLKQLHKTDRDTPLQELEEIMPKKNILFLLNTLAAEGSSQQGVNYS